MHFKKIKTILKKLLNENTNTIIGNLTYLSILAIAPTITISTSLLNILSNYYKLNTIPLFTKIYTVSSILNLSPTTNLIINILCINLLSNGIFYLLSNLEKIYHFKFETYIKKKLYSLALSLILLLTIIALIVTVFFVTKQTFLNKIDFLINLTIIFLSILTFYKLSTFQSVKNLYSGAIISSLFLTIFLEFFFYIINNFSKLKYYYGLLAPIIATILLIYYSCYIIYSGIILNVELSKK